MAAAGKVCTGFSLPYVAKYACNDGVISYTAGRKLARGVDVSIEPDSSEDGAFYADNVAAETDAGTFTGGTANVTVDGLFQDAEKLIMGLPAAGSGENWLTYDDNQVVPYMGFGYIARYQSEGVVTWCPTILLKVQFSQIQSSHATSEETKNYQTQALSASIMRADDADHSWKKVANEDYETEAEAEAAIKEFFGITRTTPGAGG